MAHKVGLARSGQVKFAIPNSMASPEAKLLEQARSGSAVIVLSDCEVSMHQQRSRRQTMPESVFQLHKRWSVGMSNLFSRETSCAICLASGHLGHLGELRTCALCLLTLHPRCARSVVDSVAVFESTYLRCARSMTYLFCSLAPFQRCVHFAP